MRESPSHSTSLRQDKRSYSALASKLPNSLVDKLGDNLWITFARAPAGARSFKLPNSQTPNTSNYQHDSISRGSGILLPAGNDADVRA
jgi:hypothetical protein